MTILCRRKQLRGLRKSIKRVETMPSLERMPEGNETKEVSGLLFMFPATIVHTEANAEFKKNSLYFL